MIASNIDRSEEVFPVQANITDCLLDRKALSLVESHRIVPELLRFCFLQTRPRRDPYDALDHLQIATKRSAVITM